MALEEEEIVELEEVWVEDRVNVEVAVVDAVVEDTVVEDTVVEDTVVEDTVVEDTVVDDSVVELVAVPPPKMGPLNKQGSRSSSVAAPHC